MKLSIVPLPQIQAIARACPGFAQELLRLLEQGEGPSIKVIRVDSGSDEPRWYVDVQGDNSHKILLVNKTHLEGMAAIAPIFIVDFVESVRLELSEVFALEGFEEGVQKVVPFERMYRRTKSS